MHTDSRGLNGHGYIPQETSYDLWDGYVDDHTLFFTTRKSLFGEGPFDTPILISNNRIVTTIVTLAARLPKSRWSG